MNVDTQRGEMNEFSGHLHQKGWKAEIWKAKDAAISGLLLQKGWRSEAWMSRRYILRGKILYCYLGNSERSAYLIDAESFATVIQNGAKDNGARGFFDDAHKFIFTIRTKNRTTGYSMNNITLSAPDENALNDWLEALSAAAFEGQLTKFPNIWPKPFRNQVNIFTISYDGRNVNNGNSFKSFQLEGPPFGTFSDRMHKIKEVSPLLSRLRWATSGSFISSTVAPTDVALLNAPVLKLFYTLIMISSKVSLEGSDEPVSVRADIMEDVDSQDDSRTQFFDNGCVHRWL